MTLIAAYDTRTGEKLQQLVPAHWIGHPVLGEGLAKTPRQKAAEKAAAKPAAPSRSNSSRRSTASGSTASAPATTTQTPAAGDTSKE